MEEEGFSVKVLDGAKVPELINGVYKLYSNCSGKVDPRCGAKIPAGFMMKIPKRYFGKIQSTRIKKLGGVVDSDYRGEVCVIVYNDSDEEFVYEKGDEIGEMAVCEIITPNIREAGDYDPSL
ncbi:deoxyuridine 5'triphosphate nucleotidohydrolase [Encephalitozoon intestinalis ATCC 50506]|uniref:Deoxyuridine 5'-triphosphate nucleotidohydrolase n=1 Tax=Encephalitozoon intestinalis (strain ATCC 50506) TaxID=876142 RepID=E0S747_ENCIT|nr:deoxyuridine 5'triphosphate nucleotidohydrolase [Encephalitozoon intestinalis ATCC 50506]ADM11475.1 deoxyuridine 5'triphosphate nucleotidohydrolase [Encephalitozoon intestinalis ATCC 50506]UTX45187.1 deoxyuridine 5'triphosphate nucleotidohydrolase [Encephalitozoon intestinalis]